MPDTEELLTETQLCTSRSDEGVALAEPPLTTELLALMARAETNVGSCANETLLTATYQGPARKEPA